MVLSKTRLEDAELDLNPIVGGAAITLVTQLSRESWSLAGFDYPTYERRDVSIRFVPRLPPKGGNQRDVVAVREAGVGAAGEAMPRGHEGSGRSEAA